MRTLQQIIILIFATVVITVSQTTYTTTTTGNISAMTWSPVGTPGSSDNIVIAHSCTLDVDLTVAQTTINSGRTLTIPSSKTLGGNLIVNGLLSNGAGGAVLTLNGNVTCSGASAHVRLNSGTASINNVGSGKTFTLSNGATFTTTKGADPISAFSGVTWVIDNSTALTTIVFNTSSNTTLPVSLPDGQGYGNVKFTTSTSTTSNKTITMSADMNILGDVTFGPLNNSATYSYTWDFAGYKIATSGVSKSVIVTQAAAHVVKITGTGSDLFTGFSTYNFVPPSNGNCTVEYASTTGTQNIVGGSYQKMSISGGGNKSLSGNSTISELLTLTSGLVSIGSSNLTLSSAATISGTPSASNMIVATGSGELRKSFSADASFTFPVGDNTGTAEYSPVNVNLTAGGYSSAYVGVKLSNAKESNNASGTDYLNRYWVLSSSGLTSPSYSATFTYVPADVAGTENNLIGGKYDGSWVVLNPVNDVAHTFTGSGLTTFSTFSAGETSSLPVELTSFSVKASQRSAELKWSTATELNNHGFEIERRSNGNWSKAGFVSGSGNSSSAKMYSYVDANLNAGRYEYRLKQIDNDGSFKYVGSVESAEVGAAAKVFGLSDNYPNPFNPATSIEFTVAKDGIAVLKVYNLIGQEVAALFSGAAQAGKINRVEFNAKDLPSGIYFSKLQVGNQQIVKKMMLMK